MLYEWVMIAKTRKKTRRGGGTVTLKEVAEHAGVAMMTVSRAINNPDAVSEELRTRIDESIKALGYVQNRFAGVLASVRTKLVTVVVPSLSSRVFAEIVRGADTVLSPGGYQILVSNTFFSLDDEEAVCRKVLGWRPEGIIVSGVDHNENTRALLRNAGVPVVEALELGRDPIDINIGLSHFEAGRTVGRYLIKKGYRRCAFIGAQMDIDFRAQRRLAGFQTALEEAGIEIVYRGDYDAPSTFEVGAQALSDLTESGQSVDALFCVNDELAVGAICESRRRGIAVPGKLAIAGFNDLDISGQIVPGLTTIRSPRERIGELSAEAILRRIDGEVLPRAQVDVGFELIERQSA